MIVGEITDHRSREGGAMIYPVYSRRSGGLSVGINLFPDHKVCSFDCPYCEVFPFKTDIVFDLEIMKTALSAAILEAKNNKIPVKDICFSGNGEPTMSPFFTEALIAASVIQKELVPDAQLVLITNGTGLLNKDMFTFLKAGALEPVNLVIWLKLDAATETWYGALNRSDIPHSELLFAIRSFAASHSPFTIQTMLCKIKGALPSQEENTAWVQLVTELALLSVAEKKAGEVPSLFNGLSGLKAVQLYGKARPACEDLLAEAVFPEVLEERASLLLQAFKKLEISLPVDVYR